MFYILSKVAFCVVLDLDRCVRLKVEICDLHEDAHFVTLENVVSVRLLAERRLKRQNTFSELVHLDLPAHAIAFALFVALHCHPCATLGVLQHELSAIGYWHSFRF